MRVWGSQRKGGYAMTPRKHLCAQETLDFGRKSRYLPGFSPKMECVSGHVPASFIGMAARPPSYDRGNVFFMTIPTQKAGQMWGFGGTTMPTGPLKVDRERYRTLPFSRVPEEVFVTLR